MKTISKDRIDRAQRALFEALGQIAIVGRMVQGAEETGQFGQGVRSITVPRENTRHDEREAVDYVLRRLSDQLEAIDERLEELKKGTTDGRTD